jgi:hypothetical protein
VGEHRRPDVGCGGERPARVFSGSQTQVTRDPHEGVDYAITADGGQTWALAPTAVAAGDFAGERHASVALGVSRISRPPLIDRRQLSSDARLSLKTGPAVAEAAVRPHRLVVARRSGQIGVLQDGLIQVGAAQVDARQVGYGEVSALQVGTAQVRAAESAPAEVSASQVGVGQVGTLRSDSSLEC